MAKEKGTDPSKYRDSRRCPNCGSLINHDDTFCHKCLTEIEGKHKDLIPFDYPDR